MQVLVPVRTRAGHLQIHGLFPAEVNVFEKPPDHGMKPEQGASHPFNQVFEPVLPQNVLQFMADGCVADGTGTQPGGQQDDGPQPAKRRRALQAVHLAYLHTRDVFHFDGPPAAAQCTQLGQARRQLCPANEYASQQKKLERGFRQDRPRCSADGDRHEGLRANRDDA